MKNKENHLYYIWPGLVLAWLCYILEFLLYGNIQQMIIEWQFELKVFVFYNLIGVIAGIAGGGIVAPKQKKYLTIVDFRKKNYSIFFLKALFTGTLLLLLFLIRTVIARPSIFAETLNNQNFWLHGVINFLIAGFSPLYFTLLIFVFLLVLLYRVSETIILSDGLLKTIKYFVTVGGIIYFLFSYDALNATNEQSKKNLFFFGFGQNALKDYDIISKNNPCLLLDSLTNSSYRFENLYTTATGSYPAIASILSSQLPAETGLVREGLNEQLTAKYSANLINKLQNEGYQVVIILPQEIESLEKFIQPAKAEVIAPPKFKHLTDKSLFRHPLLLGFLNHELLIDYIFPEYLLVPGSQYNEYLADKLSSFATNDKPLALFYFSFPDFKNLPYPYYRSDETVAKKSYANQTAAEILDKLEEKRTNSLIMFCGLNQDISSLNSTDLKQPLICYDSNTKKKKNIKTIFSNKDIGSILLDLLAIKTDDYQGSIRNLTNAATMPEDLMVFESWSSFTQRTGTTSNDQFAYQLYNSYAKRTVISGKLKYDYLPNKSGITTYLTGLDLLQKTDSKQNNKKEDQIRQKMIILQENIHLKSDYRTINGYFIK